MKNKKTALLFIALLNVFSFNTFAQTPVVYDVVLLGGRVIDPETKLDAIRNVGILNNRIAQISSEPLRGKETINVSGLVVAPGFIDPHIHGVSNKEQEYQLHDGVTTALELELGVPFLSEWYASRQAKALINYGASANWGFARMQALGNYANELLELKQAVANGSTSSHITQSTMGVSYYKTLDAAQAQTMLANIKNDLAVGGIGIGVFIGYVPGATPEEIFRVYQLAGEMQATIFTHVREPNLTAVQQAISDAVLTNAPLHIVHLNSMTLGQIQVGIEMVQTAQKRGFNITTEVYPYTAASTMLNSNMFSDGWQQRLGMDYQDLQWVATGERLTKETFDKYKTTRGGVIMHMMKPEWIRAGIGAKDVMIGSDGSPYAQLAHPRTAGTFSRVLGKYVREDKVLDLPTAIEKMTFMTAKMLEKVAPMMRFKGRIQVGMDADLTIFNPNTVIDKATFEEGLKFSEGIEYVMVNGSFVLRNGKTVANVFPGQAVYGKFKK
jgi:N-acyl-D-aspartate/D-glutamate deacylase